MTSLEEAVMSRRPAIEGDEDENNDDWDVRKEEWMEGSGASRPKARGNFDKMINDLYVKLGMLKAKNTSPKL